MALPLLKAAGIEFRNQDDNDTGADDIKGYTCFYVIDLVQALISDDVSKMQALLNKTSPIK